MRSADTWSSTEAHPAGEMLAAAEKADYSGGQDKKRGTEEGKRSKKKYSEDWDSESRYDEYEILMS